MEAAQSRFEALDVCTGGLDKEENLGGGFDVALPAIDGSEAGNDIEAGGELIVKQGAGDLLGLFARACCGEDETCVDGGYGHVTGNRE